MEEALLSDELPKFSDIRRYFCPYCGICRSKKTLITSHINSQHKEELEKAKDETEHEAEATLKTNTCEECGASFKKHAYLLQHMQSHSLERPYVCTLEDCNASYRRKDHLNRHLLQHQGKNFKCPIENCKSDFSLQSNLKRHIVEMHDENSTPARNGENQKRFVCPEIGCGKVFRYASKLQKHEDSHVMLETVDVVCLEPGCLKHFTNSECLKAHVKSCHQYVTCDTCGTTQLKKNMKRHLRTHETGGTSTEPFKCEFKDCDCTFTTKSNLRTHEKAVHFELRRFVCGFTNCGMRFAYKHVRDNHEKTAKHLFTLGDFEEADEEFRSRPRGGVKRKYPTVDMLVRKRVTPPGQLENLFSMQACEQDGSYHSPL